MSNISLRGHTVSIQWLARHLHFPELIIFDASMAMPGAAPITQMASQIGNAQFFNINEICDKNSALPHMMPTAEQFTTQVQKLGVNQNSVIVVYDDKGVFSSARVWWMFKAMGFEQIAVLDGGLPAWKKAGFQIDIDPRPNLKQAVGDFVATYQQGYFCDAKRVFSALADPRINVLDARSEARFSGTEKDPRAGVRSGHMPGALNLHYAQLFETSGANAGLFKPKEALTGLFNKISPNHRSLIFSCGSGVTACVLALAASIVGYTDLMVYDGSWSEWGSRSDCPVVFN